MVQAWAISTRGGRDMSLSSISRRVVVLLLTHDGPGYYMFLRFALVIWFILTRSRNSSSNTSSVTRPTKATSSSILSGVQVHLHEQPGASTDQLYRSSTINSTLNERWRSSTRRLER